MNGASKILTVSYGTFSCTLEGFDDPFNTMKAIAEYFRDLAADDRYFGAEPPTPDAAMLHRIAEREIQRRVEAKIGEHGVVLRAGDAAIPQVSEQAAAPAAPAPVTLQGSPAASEPVARQAAPAEVLAEPQAARPSLADPVDAAPAVESAAARLLRLRAAQAQIQPQIQPAVLAQAAAAAPSASDAEAYAEDQEPAPALAMPAMATEETEQVSGAAALAETPMPATQEDETDLPVLQSLRETLAGLGQQDDQLAADMAEAALPADLADDAPSVEPAIEPEVEIEIEAFTAPFEDTDPEAPVAPVEVIVEEPIIDDVAYVEVEEPVSASAEISLADERAAPEIEVEASAPVTVEKLQRARARVIKIRRLDKREPAPQPLSVEDEDDLAKTLSALEAEAGLVAEVASQAEAQPQAGARPEPGPATAGADASVDRILAETNQKLEVPEVKRRRSAIAHLKAAILATVADRRANPKAQVAETEAKADPYRKDLDKVVRPTAPTQTGERPAPLVLVSAQRIDRKPEADANRPMPQIVSSTPAPTGALSVRPRRVTAGGAAQVALPDADEDVVAEAIDLDGKQSFAEFADSLGAASLSELLEAAGAYCTLVLDRPSFSRPLLFQQVSQLPAMAETKREDSLRNFGKLLREGRFQKTVRGQFALADTSPILTEAKRLAG